MNKIRVAYSNSSTDFYFNARFSQLKDVVDRKRTVIVTDRNIFRLHQKKFSGWNTVVIKAGEKNKVQSTVEEIVKQLIAMQVDRTWTIIGVGGGVVTDLTGYVGSIFLRGIRTGFIPTSLLAMVDAAIGGKNGIDLGVYKNMLGTIRQPGFIVYDQDFLTTLPLKEWRNGFAEIIKHACIGHPGMFRELKKNDLDYYRSDSKALSDLITKNAKFKIGMVKADEFEQRDRKLLNLGHTLGHAIENLYGLMHGEAIAIGMIAAANFSASLTGFEKVNELIAILSRYGLPTHMNFNSAKVFNVMTSDKKRSGRDMNYILLEEIGRAVAVKIPLPKLKKLIGDL